MSGRCEEIPESKDRIRKQAPGISRSCPAGGVWAEHQELVQPRGLWPASLGLFPVVLTVCATGPGSPLYSVDTAERGLCVHQVPLPAASQAGGDPGVPMAHSSKGRRLVRNHGGQNTELIFLFR